MNLGRIRIGRLAAHSGARRTRRGQFRSRIRRCNPCCFLGLRRRRRLSSRIRQRFRCVLGFQNCRIRGGLRGRDNGRLCRLRSSLSRRLRFRRSLGRCLCRSLGRCLRRSILRFVIDRNLLPLNTFLSDWISKKIGVHPNRNASAPIEFVLGRGRI